MSEKFSVGDSVNLKRPERGYRYAEVIGFDGVKIIIRLTSGYELAVYEDELEEY